MTSVTHASDTSAPSLADVIAAELKAAGATHAFGIPGNDVLALIEACEKIGIKFVTAKSEVSAAFMADAVAHQNGGVGVCIFAMGPGIANGISGVVNALMDRAPLVVLGGDVAGRIQGHYTHQVFDQTAAMTPFVKWSTALNPQATARQIAKATNIAKADPPGPVFINCPADLTRTPAANEPSSAAASGHHRMNGKPRTAPTEPDLLAARRILAAAKRPLVLAGLGVLEHSVRQSTGPGLANLLATLGCPCLTSYKAKGVVDESCPQSLGSFGLSPTVDALTLELISDADALVLLGLDPIELRDAWLDPWPATIPSITIDAVPQTHGVFPAASVALTGHLGTSLDLLVDALERTNMSNETLAGTLDETAQWPEEQLTAYRAAVADIIRPRAPAGRISAASVFHVVNAWMDDTDNASDTPLSIDVGAHRILGSHVLRLAASGQMLQSNGLCCMGYAIPAAAGVALATSRRTIAMAGDGSTLMSLGELSVLAQHNLPVTVVVINDDSLSLIALKQEKLGFETSSVAIAHHDFAKMAEGFGIANWRVSTDADFAKALAAANASTGPALIEAVVDGGEYREQM